MRQNPQIPSSLAAQITAATTEVSLAYQPKSEADSVRIYDRSALRTKEGVLAFGTPEEVSREVEEHLRILAPGGGYVLAAVHNIQTGVPPENVIAMFDTALSFGRYDEQAAR